MLESAKVRADAPSNAHPRRTPAHLSVSLRHKRVAARSLPRSFDATSQQGTPAAGQMSNGSSNSRRESSSNAREWFDNLSGRPQQRILDFRDDGSAPLLPSCNSEDTSKDSLESRPLGPDHRGNLSAIGMGSGDNVDGSREDDYRSVIDDLTVENKRLKEKCRRYEASRNAHLEKDRLFEVRYGALSWQKRRELDEILRNFTSSAGPLTDEDDRQMHVPHPSLMASSSGLKKSPSNCASDNSRPADSGYASRSGSGQASFTTRNHAAIEGTFGSQSRRAKKQEVQSCVHNIPEGLLPTNSLVMTEREKKKIVVQRLEQLFTGKQGATPDSHSQSLQQQVISKSAQMPDQMRDNEPRLMQGHREANIRRGRDDNRPARLPRNRNNESQASRGSDDSNDGSSDDCFPSEQRPTRPWDLDPDRAQIPADNMEYIRHLGLSTPHLSSEDSTDSVTDEHGWTYLNILVNMAQLHIIAVTADFVRVAVSEVSEKLQLSEDGKRVRWRGGSSRTRLSSDADNSSARESSIDGSSNSAEPTRKKRKVQAGKVVAFPVGVQGPDMLTKSTPSCDKLQYKPLFAHAKPWPGTISSDESDSISDRRCMSSAGHSRASERSRPVWEETRRCDEGPVVFYAGARFCTDLSGDRGGTVTPLHITNRAKDGYDDHGHNALGSRARSVAPPFSRTPSGSQLPFRPFKDYSRGPEFLQLDRPKTPELLSATAEDFFINGSTSGPESPVTSLQQFDASGLGGTQPRDHFTIRVDTKRVRKAIPPSLSSVSKNPAPGRMLRKSHHIPQATLGIFHDIEAAISSRLAALTPDLPSSQAKSPKSVTFLPIETEVTNVHFTQLEPSELPEPMGWFPTDDSDGEDSEDEDMSSACVSHLRKPRSPRMHFAPVNEYIGDSGDFTEKDNESDESDSSIDMLGQAREMDPALIEAMECEIDDEMNIERDDGKSDEVVMDIGGNRSLPLKSAVATIDSRSDSSSS